MSDSKSDKNEARFKFWGTDGCTNCDTGRITLFYVHDKCTECDPEAYRQPPTPKASPPSEGAVDERLRKYRQALDLALYYIDGESTYEIVNAKVDGILYDEPTWKEPLPDRILANRESLPSLLRAEIEEKAKQRALTKWPADAPGILNRRGHTREDFVAGAEYALANRESTPQSSGREMECVYIERADIERAIRNCDLTDWVGGHLYRYPHKDQLPRLVRLEWPKGDAVPVKLTVGDVSGRVRILEQEKAYGIENMKLLRAKIAVLEKENVELKAELNKLSWSPKKETDCGQYVALPVERLREHEREVEELKAEVGAYKKAKAENDERFQIEIGELKAEVERRDVLMKRIADEAARQTNGKDQYEMDGYGFILKQAAKALGPKPTRGDG